MKESILASYLWNSDPDDMIYALKMLIKSVKEGKLVGIQPEKIGIIDDKCKKLHLVLFEMKINFL